MKINKKHKRPIHLHMEYFFRKRYCLVLALAFLTFAMVKGDAEMMKMMREVYAQGFGMVGQFMREETTRVPVTFDINARVPTMSGR